MTVGPAKELTLFDAICLIVGIIVGVGVYQMAPSIARGTSGPWGLLGLWVAGGLLSLCGALGYAELASAYPREGGDYVYLTRAYGPGAGFLFGWMQLVIVRPGDIAVVAFAFSTYAAAAWAPASESAGAAVRVLAAVGAVLCLTGLHVLGVRQGKWTQNLLTVVKVLGLLALVAVAGWAPTPAEPVPVEGAPLPVGLALIFVLFCFGGWNEMAYVAAELHRPRKNMVRTLVVGTGVVTGLYLLLNASFLHTLGFSGLCASEAVAADSLATGFPRAGSRLISVLICVSALGALSGLIFTGARISYAVGQDHRVFRGLGVWHAVTGTPVRALLLQGGLAIGLIVLLGSFVEAILYTAPAVYTFYLATSLAVIVLRRREPGVERPYRVTGYPWPVLLFSAACAYLLCSAVRYKPGIALAALGLWLLGVPLYLWSRRPPGVR